MWETREKYANFSLPMTITPLDRFLRFLDEQDPAAIRQGSLDHFLATERVEPDDLLSFVFFREDTYARNLVYRTEHIELLMLCWLPGNRTPIHDHGGQRAWISMHTGELTFNTYAPIIDERKLPVLTNDAEPQIAGELLYIDDSIGIHSIVNASRKPAISMHLYAAPMKKCRMWDERAKQFVWKELTYFTQNGRQARTHVLELD